MPPDAPRRAYSARVLPAQLTPLCATGSSSSSSSKAMGSTTHSPTFERGCVGLRCCRRRRRKTSRRPVWAATLGARPGACAQCLAISAAPPRGRQSRLGISRGRHAPSRRGTTARTAARPSPRDPSPRDGRGAADHHQPAASARRGADFRHRKYAQAGSTQQRMGALISRALIDSAR